MTLRAFGMIFLLFMMHTSDATDSLVSYPDRNFGYSVGDIIEQVVVLGTHDSLPVSLTELPEIQRQGRWLATHSVQLDEVNNTLTLRYQIINAPAHTRIISLPALSLATDQAIVIDIPAWPFSISPLSPVALSGDDNPLPLMQPDQRVDAPDTRNNVQQIIMLSLILLATAALWLIWWTVRGYREAQRLPFARAYRQIRQHGSTDSSEAPEPWLALHRAFDQVCGRVTSVDSVETLVSAKAWLKPFEDDITTFFRQSSRQFFAEKKPVDNLDLARLSKRLFVAEKRHTRTLDKSAVGRRRPS